MTTVTFGGKSYELDDNGFLDPSDQWDVGFAEGMAKDIGIRGDLTDDHWKMINYVRRKFLEDRTVPMQVFACMENNVRLHDLRALFPTGYHRGVCKIAGINYRFMYEHNYWLTYETAPPAKPRYQLDALGFLADFEEWDEDFAAMAMYELGSGQVLTDRHWQVIRYLRGYYAKNKNIPAVYETCQVNNLSLDALRELFPAGYRRMACLIAGLPFFV